MKKDILFPKPEGVHIAAVQEVNELNETQWFVYLINTRKEAINNILITSKGYGKVDGEEKITSTLRKKLLDMNAETAQKFELIPDELIGFTNEFWLSFYIGNQIYDKKYIFMPESLINDNKITIPVLDKEGILIE
jgi:hypothetical protein